MNKGNPQIAKVAHLGGKTILRDYGKNYFKELAKKSVKKRKELKAAALSK